jgi:hypothetical protein
MYPGRPADWDSKSVLRATKRGHVFGDPPTEAYQHSRTERGQPEVGPAKAHPTRQRTTLGSKSNLRFGASPFGLTLFISPLAV